MGKRARQIEAVTEVVPALAQAHVPVVAEVIERLRDEPGALLPVLHAIQQALGYVPEGAVAPVAAALGLTRADVHGVISFYHDFRTTPPAAHSLRLCRAEACQAMGARALERHARQRLGIGAEDSRSADGRMDVDPAYCLGNCALAPAALIDGELHGRLTPDALDRLLDAMGQAAEAGA